MLIRTWCLCCAGVLALQILSLHALPFALAEPGATLWHLLAFAGLTLLAWIATDGAEPMLVTGGAMLFAVLTFPVGAAGAALAGAILYWKTGARACAESSAR